VFIAQFISDGGRPSNGKGSAKGIFMTAFRLINSGPKALLFSLLAGMFFSGCGQRERIESLDQLAEKEFAVPAGTIADKLVLSKFPKARFQYFNSVLDACITVRSGKADAAAYDEPILRNFAAKNPGMKVLDGMITVDEYGFAVRQDEPELKQAIDEVLQELKASGDYDEMMARWFPETGAPLPMPEFKTEDANGILRFGTASITEPFSFVDASREVVGLDIELANRFAKKLGKKLEIVNMDFGGMIPALAAGKVDIIGACITITPERAERVLFSQPYYIGGIAALVRE
jgi:polar amino acid transport system substrate-binding protein